MLAAKVRGGCVFLLLATLGIVACGGGGGSSNPPTPTPPAISVSVSPATPATNVTRTIQFSATVSNASNTAVTWSVQEGSAGGTITAAGLYTAPSTAGSYHVIATSVADTSKTASAAVTVRAPVSVAINPATITLDINGTQTFAATVNNSTNTNVTWALTGGASAGTVTTAGTYTAPKIPGVYHVTATSQDDPSASATAAITVRPAAPVFSTTAPTSANEGDVYRFTVAASDPSDGTVSLALTNAPMGAALNGTELTWTPTADQARTANAFAIKATTSYGGTATLAWSVEPTGTVRGTTVSRYVAVDGTSNDVPVDLSTAKIEAWSQNSNGTWSVAQGSGTATGAFSIPQVPAGFYWLRINNTLTWTSFTTFTNTNVFPGKGAAPRGTTQPTVTFNFTGLEASANGSILTYTPSYDSTVLFDTTGGLTTDASISGAWPGALLDGGSDKLYISELVPRTAGSVSYIATSRVSAPAAVTITEATGATVTTSMTPVAEDRSLQLNISSAFSDALTQINPGAANAGFSVRLKANPFGSQSLRSGPDVLLFSTSTPTYANSGALTFGQPYPDWSEVLTYTQSARISYTAPGATSPVLVPATVSGSTVALPTAAAPITPHVVPIGSITVQGNSFFTGADGITQQPTITWQAPAANNSPVYTLTVQQLGSQGTNSVMSALFAFITLDTSAKLPPMPELLQAGKSYVFALRAMAAKTDGSGKVIEQGTAETWSGVFKP